MTTKNLAAWNRNPNTGLLQWDYPTINLNNNWKIAAPYRLNHVFDMIPVHPKHSSAGTMAYFKWADTKSEYVCRPSWFGGEPPFRLTLLTAPTGATLGGSLEQTFNRTLSSHADIYIHSLPDDYATIRWQPTIGQHGATYDFKMLVEDQTGAYLIFRWTVTVDDTKFKYFDAMSGSDAAAGTFSAPYQTFGFGYNLSGAQNYIYKYKAGTYNVHNGVSGNDAAFNSTHCKSHIGINNGVIFNVSGGNFSTGVSDICIMNATITGGRTDKQNVRQIDLDVKSDRLTLNRVAFDTTVIGINGGDNPCGVMTWNLGTPYHDNTSITDCSLSSTSKCSMFILFGPKNSIVENCTSSGSVMTANNGSFIGHFKDSVYNTGLRFCDFSGDCANSVFAVSNQANSSRCQNADLNFNRFVSVSAIFSDMNIRWNGQHNSGDTLASGQYAQRLSLNSGGGVPLQMEKYTALGDLVNYSGNLFQRTGSTINGSSTGGQSVGITSAKVADINTIAADDIGKRGWVIASTLVN